MAGLNSEVLFMRMIRTKLMALTFDMTINMILFCLYNSLIQSNNRALAFDCVNFRTVVRCKSPTCLTTTQQVRPLKLIEKNRVS